MTAEAAVAALREKFSAAILEVTEHRGETTVTVRREDIVPVCTFLKTEQGFNFLADVCSLDDPGAALRFTVVYNLYSIGRKERLRVKAQVPESDARIDTVCGVWGAANWFERECWDMMGIVFTGHPDPRRILMPDDWEGHPLRKDYPLQGPDREPYQGRLS